MNNNLPTMRLRRSGYNLLSLVRETANRIEEDLRRIRDAERTQTSETFQWKVNMRGVWWLHVNNQTL